ncbi:transposase [Celeribacter halophilus]|uniref:Transposase n=1 Tax=Celeribacter halophilus TaxID=576117 RepID=A0A1I3X0Q5_9RHOB|nr:transposase [Celeribacter halophilus]SFK12787.1 transposase [Celeribacter halophilus]
MNKGIRFTDEFKQDAVALVVERGYAVSEVAERLGISTESLYTWKAQFAKSPRVRSEVAEQAAEIRRLKRELARVTEERTILKKGETIFRHWSEDNGRTRTSRESLSEVRVY